MSVSVLSRWPPVRKVSDRGRDFELDGVTPDEQQELLAWPGSGRLIHHLRELPGPLRLADFSAYLPGHADA